MYGLFLRVHCPLVRTPKATDRPTGSTEAARQNGVIKLEKRYASNQGGNTLMEDFSIRESATTRHDEATLNEVL
uniref:Uncharacterized protein n=1 Tax=Anopheles minimus TaxID=112268 RepID=A0A182W096_9DIPT